MLTTTSVQEATVDPTTSVVIEVPIVADLVTTKQTTKPVRGGYCSGEWTAHGPLTGFPPAVSGIPARGTDLESVGGRSW